MKERSETIQIESDYSTSRSNEMSPDLEVCKKYKRGALHRSRNCLTAVLPQSISLYLHIVRPSGILSKSKHVYMYM
jgi:hypothetical protein